MTTDLIARLEEATEPSVELDEAISDAFGIDRRECCGSGVQHHPEEPPECCGNPILTKPLPYTSSLDAAASLVPEGWSYAIEPWFHTEYSRLERRAVMFQGHCFRPNWSRATPMDTDSGFLTRVSSPQHSHAATALTIAALRALSAHPGTGEG